MKKDRKNVIQRLQEKVKPENKQFIAKNIQISNQISSLIEKKGMNQGELARRIGKEASSLSRILSGTNNLTLRTITDMEVALGEDIIITPLKACETYKSIEYVSLWVYGNPNKKVERKTVCEEEVNYEHSEQSLAS